MLECWCIYETYSIQKTTIYHYPLLGRQSVIASQSTLIPHHVLISSLHNKAERGRHSFTPLAIEQIFDEDLEYASTFHNKLIDDKMISISGLSWNPCLDQLNNCQIHLRNIYRLTFIMIISYTAAVEGRRRLKLQPSNITITSKELHKDLAIRINDYNMIRRWTIKLSTPTHCAHNSKVHWDNFPFISIHFSN